MTNSLILPFLLLSLSPQVSQKTMDWETVRGIAEAEYEVLVIIIERHEWEKVPEKARSLFALPFPSEHEHMKVEAAREYVNRLVRVEQTQLAHVVLDAALDGLKLARNQADIFREKGFVCEKEGLEEQARTFFEKSLELERKGP